MPEKILNIIKSIIPKKLFVVAQPTYHYLLSLIGSLLYRHPSGEIMVIGVTGTKGKSTTTEMLNAVLEGAGFKTAILSTIRFKIGKEERRNMYKMTMPGRFFVQKFLREAVANKCDVAIVEMTSEGAKQYRHRFIDLDALIVTNISPEHIESHGSYEKYLEAKLSIARELEGNPSGTIVVNADTPEAEKFLNIRVANKIKYSLRDAINVKANERGSSFQIGKIVLHTKIPGLFNVYNMLGVIALAKHLGVKDEDIKKGLESLGTIRGRMEKVDEGQDFDIVVDYAHTKESLEAIYGTYKDHYTVCVLGNTGGGRDKWKREEMGKVADTYCSEIILTNEDPYDEDPQTIVEEMKKGVVHKQCEIIMDRRNAIYTAIERASTLRQAQGTRDQNRVAVLITGKGTDPYIMEANGKKTPWDDVEVTREELRKVLNK